jgi:hypothetical protein
MTTECATNQYTGVSTCDVLRATEPAEPGQVSDADRQLASFINHNASPASIQAATAHRQLGIAQGRAQERAEIVAWLRDVPWPMRNDALIAAFEAGEHRSKT